MNDGLGGAIGLPRRNNDNGFSNTIMYCLAVGMNKVLQKAKTKFKRRSTVSESPFNRMPER